MAITRAQQAKQLLNKIAPKGERLAYINSREAKLLKKMGGAGIDVNGTGIKSYFDPGVGAGSVSESLSEAAFGSGGAGDSDGGNFGTITGGYREAERAAAAQAARVEEQRKERERQEKQQKITDSAVEQARVNPFGKTFVDRGYVNPSTFDVRAAANRPPPVDEEETLLDKGIDYAKGTAKNMAIGSGLGFLGVANPFGLTALAVSKMISKGREEKARKDAVDAAVNNARLSGSFTTQFNPTRTTRPDITPDGDNEFPLIQAPFMIQPNIQQEVIEEEPTPYDFDLYAARDNKVARRFAQGGRTGFNMGGMEEENLQAGAPNLRLEGSQIPQQEEMASAPGIDAELYQLFLDALRKGDVPQGTTFDAYKQLMMEAMSQQQGGQMQEQEMMQSEMMQPQMQEGIMQAQMMEPEREMAAYGGIMGSDGRRAYGFGSFFKKAARAVKKVFKSPIAKAALIAAGGYYAGGGNLFGLQRAAGKKMIDGAARGFKLGDINPMKFFQNKDSVAQKIKNYAAKEGITYDQAAKIVGTGGGAGSGLGQTLATIGIPLAMAGVYKQGKADERPMDENTLARIGQYNDPLFEDGIAGARARIQAGDNRGFNFMGPDNIYRQTSAQGGRIGYQDAGPVRPEINTGQIEMLIKKGADNDLIKTFVDGALDNDINQIRDQVNNIMRNNKAQGGMMNLGGNEMDLRGGGFVPLGAKEKADDVPARLSKNEFVFTADAVRAAGGGSVDKGAEKMYNTMKRLEGVMA